jgi:hypothetical protein
VEIASKPIRPLGKHIAAWLPGRFKCHQTDGAIRPYLDTAHAKAHALRRIDCSLEIDLLERRSLAAARRVNRSCGLLCKAADHNGYSQKEVYIHILENASNLARKKD